MKLAPLPAPQPPERVAADEEIWPDQPSITLQPPAGQPVRVNLKPNLRLLLPVERPSCSTKPSFNEFDWIGGVTLQFEPALTKVPTALAGSTHTVILRSARVSTSPPGGDAIMRFPLLGKAG